MNLFDNPLSLVPNNFPICYLDFSVALFLLFSIPATAAIKMQGHNNTTFRASTACNSLRPSISPVEILSIIHQDDTSDSDGINIIFGVLGLIIAIIGLALASLQLRHMYRRRRSKVVLELA